MSKRVNHKYPDFLAEESWEYLNKDGYPSGYVFYFDFDSRKIKHEYSSRLIARKNIFSDFAETWFNQEIETPLSSFMETFTLSSFDACKPLILLMMTAPIKSGNIEGFSKKWVDEQLQRPHWDNMTKLMYNTHHFFFLKSKFPLYLNIDSNGLIWMPPVRYNDTMTYKDYVIGMPITKNIMLCMSRKYQGDIADTLIEKYYVEKNLANRLHMYSVGLRGNIILPFGSASKSEIETAMKDNEIAQIEQFLWIREVIQSEEKAFYEIQLLVEEMYRRMGLLWILEEKRKVFPWD